jgi:hypothetical protein
MKRPMEFSHSVLSTTTVFFYSWQLFYLVTYNENKNEKNGAELILYRSIKNFKL